MILLERGVVMKINNNGNNDKKLLIIILIITFDNICNTM